MGSDVRTHSKSDAFWTVGPEKTNWHATHKPSDRMDLLISAVNKADLGWKADTCKLQKHHPDHNCGETSLAQTGSSTDEAAEVEADAEVNEALFKKSLASAQEWATKYDTAASIPDSDLPESYDFRSVHDHDFTTAPRDQGHCGSCFTFGFIQALEARLRVKTGKEVPKLSAQQVLSCNFLNEGCEGGWPHLNGYFMEHAHLVEESCAGYKASTKGQTCSKFSQCKPIAKVGATRKVGGFGLGQVTERDIQKELVRNGPLSVEFDATHLFQTYKSGIISEEGLKGVAKAEQAGQLDAETISNMSAQEIQDLLGASDDSLVQLSGERQEPATTSSSGKTMNEAGFSWMAQNHTVLMVGWGVDKPSNTKYWIIRNSYGPNWGEKGDFRIRRG